MHVILQRPPTWPNSTIATSLGGSCEGDLDLMINIQGNPLSMGFIKWSRVIQKDTKSWQSGMILVVYWDATHINTDPSTSSQIDLSKTTTAKANVESSTVDSPVTIEN